MATADCTEHTIANSSKRVSIGDHGFTMRRASGELKAAANALHRVTALLCVIKDSLEHHELEDTLALTLVDIGLELTGTYGQRADDEAQAFAEVSHE